MILRVENIRAGYNSIEVLKGVSFEINKGFVYCVIGPNGAGKSTIFRTVAGLLSVKSGRVFFKGQDVTKEGPLKRFKKGIAFVPQGRCNFPYMSVEENLEMGCFSLKDKKKTREYMSNIFEFFPILYDRRKQLALTMSGGEQQILEMARGLLLSPDILLLDEPSLGLSPKITQLVFEKIREIQSLDTTVIMIEQNAKRGLSVSDFGIVIEVGKVKLVGTGQDLLNNSAVRKAYLGG